MKIGLRVSFLKPEKSGEHPFEPALRFVSGLGLDGVELCLDPRSPWGEDFGAWSEDLTVEDRQKIVRLCRSYGVELASVSSDWAWGYSRYCPRLRHWSRGLEIFKEDIRLTADLGGKVLLIHFGISKAENWEEAKSILSSLVDVAEDYDVKLGIEGGIWARLGLGGLRELCRMVDEIGSNHLGVYEHCYWPRGTMRPHEEIELVGHRMVGLHSGRIDLENIDYEAMFKALKKYYDWYWIFEIDEWSEVKENFERLRKLMEKYW